MLDDNAPYRALASAIVRQAIDDLAVPTRRSAALAFLENDFIGGIWHDWLRHFVNGCRLSDAIRLSGRRRRRANPVRARGPYGRRETRYA